MNDELRLTDKAQRQNKREHYAFEFLKILNANGAEYELEEIIEDSVAIADMFLEKTEISK